MIIVREMYSIINILFALMAVPPAVYMLLIVLNKERNVVDSGRKKTNRALSYLFGGIALGALINASIALLSLAGKGILAHDVSPIRSAYINIFFATVTWLMYFVRLNNETK